MSTDIKLWGRAVAYVAEAANPSAAHVQIIEVRGWRRAGVVLNIQAICQRNP